MTPVEQKVLDFIKQYHQETGETPTSVAIGKHCGFSGQRARVIIASLIEKGKLQKAIRLGLYKLPG